MDRERVMQAVEAMVRRTLSDLPSELSESAHIMSDLGATSVDVVDLLFSMEEQFEIKISDKEASALRTIGEIVDFTCARSSARLRDLSL
jgi:acyl carrier protein